MASVSTAVARILTRAAYARTAQEFNEEMLEKMESMGAGDEIVTLWQELDRKAARSSAAADPAALTPAVRDGTFRHIEKFARVMWPNREAWNAVYPCVTLFDIFCKRCAVTVQDVPALVVAVVGIVKKADDATTCLELARLAQYASQVAHWIARLPENAHSNIPQVVTEEALQRMELRVLNSIGWFIQFPTIESWASAILARLNVLSGARYVQSMQWIWQTHLFITMRLVLLRQAATPDMTAGRAASGLFCLGLCAARLVPTRAFMPLGADEASWALLIAECQPQGQAAPCCLPAEQTADLLAQLPIATGRSLEDLRDDCAKVAMVMRQAMADINRQRLVGQPMQSATV